MTAFAVIGWYRVKLGHTLKFECLQVSMAGYVYCNV